MTSNYQLKQLLRYARQSTISVNINSLEDFHANMPGDVLLENLHELNVEEYHKLLKYMLRKVGEDDPEKFQTIDYFSYRLCVIQHLANKPFEFNGKSVPLNVTMINQVLKHSFIKCVTGALQYGRYCIYTQDLVRIINDYCCRTVFYSPQHHMIRKEVIELLQKYGFNLIDDGFTQLIYGIKHSLQCAICNTILQLEETTHAKLIISQTCTCNQQDKVEEMSEGLYHILIQALTSVDSSEWANIMLAVMTLHGILCCMIQARGNVAGIEMSKLMQNERVTAIGLFMRGLICALTCADGGPMRYVRLISLPPAHRIGAILINSILIPRMCTFGKCKCISQEFGIELEKHKPVCKVLMEKKGIVAGYYHKGLALSHVWGDQLLLGTDNEERMRAIEQIIKVGLPWCDIVQDEFNAVACREEYKDRVIVLCKPIYRIGHLLSEATAFSTLVWSDWGERGWIAQEVEQAKELILVREVGNPIYINMINRGVHAIDLSIGRQWTTSSRIDYYNTLASRRWRRQEDIMRCLDWWGHDVIKPIDIWQRALVGSNMNTKAIRYCWIPGPQIKEDVYLEASHISENNGVLTIHGEHYILQGTLLYQKLYNTRIHAGQLAIVMGVIHSSQTCLVSAASVKGETVYSITGVEKYGNILHIVSSMNGIIKCSKDIFEQPIRTIRVGCWPEWFDKCVKTNCREHDQDKSSIWQKSLVKN